MFNLCCLLIWEDRTQTSGPEQLSAYLFHINSVTHTSVRCPGLSLADTELKSVKRWETGSSGLRMPLAKPVVEAGKL